MLSSLFTIIIYVVIIWKIYSKIKNRKKGDPKKNVKPSATPNRSRNTVKPNVEKKPGKTKEEELFQRQTRPSSNACEYRAAYSKGRPERLGARGDYEPATPSGMVRLRCAYCGAENFVPIKTSSHYHCYFCWEKL